MPREFARWNKCENLLFWLLIGLCVAQLWRFDYFPSQDGPSHVYNSMILRDLLRGHDSGWQTFFHINRFPVPNLLGHWLMAGLMLLVSPWTAEKLLLSLYVVLLPVSVRYAVGRIAPGAARSCAFLSFPLIYSLLLHKGLYNFCLSLPLFFFFVGFWIGRGGRFNARAAAVVLGLSLLVYFAHVVALLEAYLTVGLWSLVALIAEMGVRRRATNADAAALRPRILLPRVVMPILALAPSLILTRFFFQTQLSQPTWYSLHDLWTGLLQMNCLISYRLSEEHVSMAVLGLFVVLAAAGMWRVVIGRKRIMHDSLLAAVAAAVVLYFITPNAARGGGLISPRLMLFIFLILILWLACTPLPRWAGTAVMLLSSVLCLAMLGTYAKRYREFNEPLHQYLACAQQLSPGATLMTICVSDHGNAPDGQPLTFLRGIRVFVHASAHLAVDRRLIDLTDYEAAENYFPVLYVPNASPEDMIKEDGSGFLDYRSPAGRRIQYVLVWDMLQDPPPAALTRRPEEFVKNYEQVPVSPSGFLRLYRCKDVP